MRRTFILFISVFFVNKIVVPLLFDLSDKLMHHLDYRTNSQYNLSRHTIYVVRKEIKYQQQYLLGMEMLVPIGTEGSPLDILQVC